MYLRLIILNGSTPNIVE